MHGIGNDYIYIDVIAQKIPNISLNELSKRLSDRHFGIGGDGLVLIQQSTTADFCMRMFNADGSEGNMCGNAIRCVGKYLYETGYISTKSISIETLSGIKELTLEVENNKVTMISVDMGIPSFEPENIPIKYDTPFIGQLISINKNEKYFGTAVSMGNPHLVIPMTNIEDYPLLQVGNLWENHLLFPNRVNTEIVEILSSNHIKMRVWERGSGETLACGTGACAAVVALTQLGHIQRNTNITVSLLGGDLEICYRNDNHVIMKGPATESFRGTFEL